MGADSGGSAAGLGSVRVVVAGTVRDRVSAGPPDAASVCLVHGNTSLAAADIGAGGEFEIGADGLRPGSYHLLVIADGREAVRRRLDVDADVHLDVGVIELVPVEWPAGVHGQLWDEAAQAAVGPGVVTMTTGAGGLVGRVRSDLDGTFAIRMSCRRPLSPGEYVIDTELAGYEPGRLRVWLVEERTVTELGRVHLDRRATSVADGA